MPDDFIPTGALEILLNITPIEEFLLSQTVRGSYRIIVSELWHVNRVGSFGKMKSHVDACNEATRFLPVLQTPADRIKKTKVFERNCECQVMDKKNAIKSESVLNQNTVKVYTDRAKPDERVGLGLYAEYSNNSPKQAFIHLGIYSTVFQAEVLAFSEGAKNMLLEKMRNQSIVVLVDSQAATKALIKCTVTSITVLNFMENLSQVNKTTSVLPGFLDMQEYMVTKCHTMQPNQDLNQRYMVLNLSLQSRMPAVLARLRTGT